MKFWPVSYSDIPENLREKLNGQSLFGSESFTRLWRTIGGHEVCWLAEEGGVAEGVMPAVEFGRWPIKRLQGLPDGLYAATILSDNTGHDQKETIQKLWSAIKSHYARVTISDFSGQLASISEARREMATTSLVDISDPQWQPPDKKIVSEIRKAERENILVETFDRTRHLDSFLALMEATEKRHSRLPKYPADFFSALAKLSETEKRIDWRYVAVGGEPVASHINLIEGDMLLNWQIYFDKRHSALKPNQYLIFEAVKRWQPEGIKKLNLGATPGSAEGVKSYKAKWGGREFSYPILHHQSGLGWLS